MSEPIGQPRYVGAALPGIDATVVLFSTVAAFPGASFSAGAGIKRLVIDIDHDQSGTIKAYRSQNRGVTWTQFDDSGAIAAPGATASTVYDVAVEEYMDWKVEWLNGGTAQTLFMVSMAFSDERSPLV